MIRRARVTLVSIPKPFKGHIGIIQRNAITSWTLLRPRPEILLLGDEDGTAALATELGVSHVSGVARNEYGTPLLSSALRLARGVSTQPVFCIINSDIILMPDFSRMLSRIAFRSFLIVGRRTDLDLTEPLDFAQSHWERDLSAHVSLQGRFPSHWASDYFVFPRDLWVDLPPFAVGRLMWDNWMIYDARRRQVPVVDATAVVTAIHQNHDPVVQNQLPNKKWNWNEPEISINLRVAGGHEHAYDVEDSSWVLRPLGVWPALGPRHLHRRLRRPPFRPPDDRIRIRIYYLLIAGWLRGHSIVRRAVVASRRLRMNFTRR